MSFSRTYLLHILERSACAAVVAPRVALQLQRLLARAKALPAGLVVHDAEVATLACGEPARTLTLVQVTRTLPSTFCDTTTDPLGDRMREAEGARALLLEIIRRAAFDWVLYRTSTRIEQHLLAEDAYVWIFNEDEDHPNFRVRKEEGKQLTAFVVICDSLDLDPDVVRGYIRNLTPNRVMSSGRPPENSRASDPQISVEVHTRIPDIGGSEDSFDFDALLGNLDVG